MRERTIVGKYRLQHGQVLTLAETVADDDGAIGSPLIRLPLLAKLELRGEIGWRERNAGERFHEIMVLLP